MQKQVFTVLLVLISHILFSQQAQLKIYSNEEGYQTVAKKYVSNTQFNNLNFHKNKSIVWSDAQNVSNNTNQDARDMGIAMDSEGVLHMTYCDDRPDLPGGYSQRITYKTKTPDGEWSEKMIIDAFNGVEPRNNHESSICVSNNNDIHVAFHYWAYDGTYRNQIGYSKLNAELGTWSTELISGPTGTVESIYSDYPRITSTESNYPVVVWGTDNRSGGDKVYLTYNDGVWHEPVLISAPLGGKAQWPDVVSIGDDKVFVVYREYNIDHSNFAFYYRIFNTDDGSLSPRMKITESERISESNYDYYDQARACVIGDEKVFIAVNVQDSIQSYFYNISEETYAKNPDNFITNINSYPNYHLLSVASDENNFIHIAYTVWNSFSDAVRHLIYSEDEGYISPIIISENTNIDAPEIIYGSDFQLHVALADDSEDTNNDGYVDREVYYTFADNTTNINDPHKNSHSFKIYPNPSNSGLYKINSNQDYNITVLNVSGHIVSTKFSNNIIDLTAQPNGVYFVKAQSENESFTKMLIKN